MSCIYGIGSKEEYGGMKAVLSVGEILDRDDFLKTLVSIQYERNDIDFSRGCFRVRGDIVEVFPPVKKVMSYVLSFLVMKLKRFRW